MAQYDAVFVGKIHLPEVGGGPIIPPELPGAPPGIWGPTDPRPTPPIYLPVVPPNVVMPPIYIPVYPSHPIAIRPPGTEVPPRPEHPIPPVVWPPLPERPPLGIWGPTDPRPQPPIYIPIAPPPVEGEAHPEHPIYFPIYPAHPIVIPGPEHPITIPPELPPINTSPPPGTVGFWGYSVYYSQPVFVPSIPEHGLPGVPDPGAPVVDPRR
jgi:hypothetical protein